MQHQGMGDQAFPVPSTDQLWVAGIDLSWDGDIMVACDQNKWTGQAGQDGVVKVCNQVGAHKNGFGVLARVPPARVSGQHSIGFQGITRPYDPIAARRKP